MMNSHQHMQSQQQKTSPSPIAVAGHEGSITEWQPTRYHLCSDGVLQVAWVNSEEASETSARTNIIDITAHFNNSSGGGADQFHINPSKASTAVTMPIEKSVLAAAQPTPREMQEE